MLACGGAWAAHGAGARRAAWWARAMPPGVQPVGGVLGVRPDGGWSTAAPRTAGERGASRLMSVMLDPTSAALACVVATQPRALELSVPEPLGPRRRWG